MHAARLRDRVTIEERQATRTATGSTATWEELETRWAAVIPVSAHLRAQYQQRDLIVTHRIVFRDPPVVKPGTHRFKWRGQVLVPASPQLEPDPSGTFSAVLAQVETAEIP
jgi:head-tail adaptor